MTSKEAMTSLEDKLKEISMSLHAEEIDVFRNNIQPDGTFNTEYNRQIFEELGKTRKQVEQLLYILERYRK